MSGTVIAAAIMVKTGMCLDLMNLTDTVESYTVPRKRIPGSLSQESGAQEIVFEMRAERCVDINLMNDVGKAGKAPIQTKQYR